MTDETPPIPNPPVTHGARLSPVDEALAFMRSNRDTHSRWAEYFETNPKAEAEYVATGVWEGAADQRRLERQYNAAITTFERLAKRTIAEPSSEEIEAVARAIVEVRASEFDPADFPMTVKQILDDWRACRPEARAALRAFLELRGGE